MQATVYFVFALLAVASASCPNITHCTCYEASSTIYCEKLDAHIIVTENYHFTNALVVDSPELFGKLVDPPKFHISVDKLSIRLTEKNGYIASLQQFFDVLSMKPKALQILGHHRISQIRGNPNYIQYLDVVAVELFYFNSRNTTNMSYLHISDTVIEPPVMTFRSSPLKVVEFINNQLSGTFDYSPAECKENETIIIKVSDQKKLEYFEFNSLVPSSPDRHKCKYHIEINYNPALQHDLLTFTREVSIIYLLSQNNLYLVMQGNPPIDCSCNFYRNYQPYRAYVHGIRCITDLMTPNGFLVKFLDEIDGTSDFSTPCVLSGL